MTSISRPLGPGTIFSRLSGSSLWTGTLPPCWTAPTDARAVRRIILCVDSLSPCSPLLPTRCTGKTRHEREIAFEEVILGPTCQGPRRPSSPVREGCPPPFAVIAARGGGSLIRCRSTPGLGRDCQMSYRSGSLLNGRRPSRTRPGVPFSTARLSAARVNVWQIQPVSFPSGVRKPVSSRNLHTTP